MTTPVRIEVNVQTGEKIVVPLSLEEIVDAEQRTAAEKTLQAIRQQEESIKQLRQQALDALLDKIEADPTILDRL